MYSAANASQILLVTTVSGDFGGQGVVRHQQECHTPMSDFVTSLGLRVQNIGGIVCMVWYLYIMCGLCEGPAGCHSQQLTACT